MQAEDWPTSALANNTEALDDLKNNVDRHRKLGCLIFDLPWDYYTDSGWKDSIERYMGKKTRHASNYGMRANTMSDSLAKEGHSVTPDQCKAILEKVNKHDPSVEHVFHKYIKDCLYANRTLRTPFGRERIFFGNILAISCEMSEDTPGCAQGAIEDTVCVWLVAEGEEEGPGPPPPPQQIKPALVIRP